MDNFPKKYNPKTIVACSDINGGGMELFSPNVPLDQKINPGSIFFMYYKDTYCKINDLIGQNFVNTTGYTVSSIYHSSLDTIKSNLPKIQLSSKIQKNISFIKNLGLDTNQASQKLTSTEEFNRYIRQVFGKLFLDKKLSNDQKTVSRSKTYQTDISQISMVKNEIETPQYTVKYFIGTKGMAINVVTTRLETIFADVAIAVNPIDKRYKKLVGQNVLIPIINKNIPIIADESVDVFRGEGAVRVTPGHDSFGLELAKKHNLPTDIFAVDTDGKFTEHAGEFAGKDVSEFLDNIIKYVDDIGNMERQTTIKETRYFDKNTGEELFPMSLTQWSCVYDYAKDYLLNYAQSEQLNINNESFFSYLEQKTSSGISNRSSRGTLIPVVLNEKGDMFCINDEIVIDIYDHTKTRKEIALTLIILNLILDNNLPQIFTLQDLIQALFSRDFAGETTKIQKYIDIFSKIGQKNSLYKNGIKSLERYIERIDKDTEKVDLLLDILKDSFAIQVEDDKIFVDYHALFGVSGLVLQTQDSFNKNFIDACRPLYYLGCEYSTEAYAGVKPENRMFLATQSEKPIFLDMCLLGLQYAKRLIFSDFILAPELVDQKGDRLNNYNSKYAIQDYYENLNKYGLDSMRLTLLLGESNDNVENSIIFDTYKANKNNLLLNKIWNANRYVYSKYKEKYNLGVIKLRDILSLINEGELTDYDIWILHNLKIVLDEFTYQVKENNYLSVGKKLFENYSTFFCDKYINISKIINNENTYKIMFFVTIAYLDLLYPFIPNFVSEIKNKFQIDYQGLNWQNLEFITREKNYKINIITELVDKINDMKQKLGLKKHEVIDVFVQANPDFLNFLKINESVVRLLTKIQNISLLGFNEEISSGCEVDNVINISIGIKKPDIVQVEVKKDILADLETEHKEKLEHIQHLKTLFASVYSNADPEVVEKKRQEIAALQTQIEDIEFQIGKLKISG